MISSFKNAKIKGPLNFNASQNTKLNATKI